jgi:hypothetical protein
MNTEVRSQKSEWLWHLSCYRGHGALSEAVALRVLDFASMMTQLLL